jgi:hypothetical protein
LWVPDVSVPGAPTALDPVGLPRGAYPGGSYPPEADPDAPGPQRGRRNGFAIAAFVLGLVGASILGLIFAIVALGQIRRSRQRGKGLAIAGLVLSLIWGAVSVGYLVLHSPGAPAKQPVSAGTHSPSPASSKSPASSPSAGPSRSGGQTANVFSLRTGDCFQNPPASQTVLGITYVTVVSCTTPHNAQVFVEFSAAGTSYPGSAALKDQADRGCHALIAKNVQTSKITNTMSLRYLYPLPTSWAGGHRTVSCLIVDSKPKLTSTLLRRNAGH